MGASPLASEAQLNLCAWYLLADYASSVLLQWVYGRVSEVCGLTLPGAAELADPSGDVAGTQRASD
jgi:hypothetical protein